MSNDEPDSVYDKLEGFWFSLSSEDKNKLFENFKRVMLDEQERVRREALGDSLDEKTTEQILGNSWLDKGAALMKKDRRRS